MSSLSRRSFLSTAAVAGAAVTGTAVTSGATAARAQSGIHPLPPTALVGISSDTPGLASGRVRFHTPSGAGPWTALPHPDGGRDGVAPLATGTVPAPPGATAVEADTTAGAQVRIIDTGFSNPHRSNYSSLPTVDVYGLPVVPRHAWGCDESLGWGDRWWGPEFSRAQVLTVHHSVTPARSDPASTVRGIHAYHTVSNGWGDIGYQLLIDPGGTIYQGRNTGGWPVFLNAPPWGVVPEVTQGAHVAGNNSGNIGICMLGDFTASLPSPAAYATLTRVLARLSEVLKINPLGGVRYHNPQGNFFRDMHAINGHRDWMATGCPGNAFYGTLGTVRTAVAAQHSTGSLGSGSAM